MSEQPGTFCQYREGGVMCGPLYRPCETCGWNPEVEAARIERRRAGEVKPNPKLPEEPAEPEPKRRQHSAEEVRQIVLENHKDFGGDMSNRTIGDVFHIDPHRVCTIRRELLAELKTAVKIQ